jgi:hypothetical protein
LGERRGLPGNSGLGPELLGGPYFEGGKPGDRVGNQDWMPTRTMECGCVSRWG